MTIPGWYRAPRGLECPTCGEPLIRKVESGEQTPTGHWTPDRYECFRGHKFYDDPNARKLKSQRRRRATSQRGTRHTSSGRSSRGGSRR
jgi:hypothetical protein